MEQKEKRMKKSEESLKDLWDTIKLTDKCILGVPEGEDKGIGNLFEETMAENFPNLRKKMDMYIQKPNGLQ